MKFEDECFVCGANTKVKHNIDNKYIIAVYSNICPICAILPVKPDIPKEYWDRWYK